MNKIVDKLSIVTDGSVNTLSKIGYGAYLAVFEHELSLDSLKALVKVKRFEDTSSTKLELQTVLWALSDIQVLKNQVTVYTDSRNIMNLQKRRARLEKNNFYSKNNRRLNNYELYQDFYRITDHLNCKFVKVRGHQASIQKDDIDRLFTLVDRASRNALRTDNNLKV
ncbi:ribonuclease HI [Desulfobacterium sp. N47]|uniref:RNase H type-1 domain-containing protein n=1 Tax=uncultured Desulfobacterium sp. TaxID=201089 RepID=E1Y8G9_9BACT|nr:hypothetical protein N47_A08920 [uncultured Desulfobacterium sp.]